MIEVEHDGRGRHRIRSDNDADVQVGADGFVELSAEAVGELVRSAASAPDTLPQSDARALLGGRA